MATGDGTHDRQPSTWRCATRCSPSCAAGSSTATTRRGSGSPRTGSRRTSGCRATRCGRRCGSSRPRACRDGAPPGRGRRHPGRLHGGRHVRGARRAWRRWRPGWPPSGPRPQDVAGLRALLDDAREATERDDFVPGRRAQQRPAPAGHRDQRKPLAVLDLQPRCTCTCTGSSASVPRTARRTRGRSTSGSSTRSRPATPTRPRRPPHAHVARGGPGRRSTTLERRRRLSALRPAAAQRPDGVALHPARVRRRRAAPRSPGRGSPRTAGPATTGPDDAHVVAAAAQLGEDVVAEPVLDDEHAGLHLARVERAREAAWCATSARRSPPAASCPPTRWRSRNSSCHWSCWSPPGVPQASTGTPSRSTRVGRERGARAAPGRQRGRQPLLQPEHLHPAAEAEAELGDGRRALQPAAARGRRDHVAPAVDDVDVAGVAAGHARPARRSARPWSRRRRGLRGARARGRTPASRGSRPSGRARAQLERRRARRPGRPRSAAYAGESSVVERDVGAVAVPGLAVGEGELAAPRRRRGCRRPSTGRAPPGRRARRACARVCSSAGPWPQGPVLATV